jgi:iron-sulfur cluster repair protein YtfE (RIC family)
VRQPEEIFEVMLESRIGDCFAKTYDTIARHFEVELRDYRRADKIYRMGKERLLGIAEEAVPQQTNQARKELGIVENLYERFCDRMNRRIEEVNKEVQKIEKKTEKRVREREEVLKLAEETEKVLANKRSSYMKGEQIVIGGIPIYVDEQFRQEVIPKGIPVVEQFYRQVTTELNRYQISNRSNGKEKDP